METLPLEAVSHDLSIWGLFWQAGWVVKLVMIGLLAASIWTWAIIIDKLIAYARMRSALTALTEKGTSIRASSRLRAVTISSPTSDWAKAWPAGRAIIKASRLT